MPNNPSDYAQKLLEQCERMEDSKRHINARMARAQKQNEGNNPNMDINTFREQLDQYRRALLTARENSKLKEQKLSLIIEEQKEKIEKLRKFAQSAKKKLEEKEASRVLISKQFSHEQKRAAKGEAKLASLETVNEKLSVENAKLKTRVISLKNSLSKVLASKSKSKLMVDSNHKALSNGSSNGVSAAVKDIPVENSREEKQKIQKQTQPTEQQKKERSETIVEIEEEEVSEDESSVEEEEQFSLPSLPTSTTELKKVAYSSFNSYVNFLGSFIAEDDDHQNS